jgi:hypothetical protein
MEKRFNGQELLSIGRQTAVEWRDTLVPGGKTTRYNVGHFVSSCVYPQVETPPESKDSHQ